MLSEAVRRQLVLAKAPSKRWKLVFDSAMQKNNNKQTRLARQMSAHRVIPILKLINFTQVWFKKKGKEEEHCFVTKPVSRD